MFVIHLSSFIHISSCPSQNSPVDQSRWCRSLPPVVVAHTNSLISMNLSGRVTVGLPAGHTLPPPPPSVWPAWLAAPPPPLRQPGHLLL